MKVSERDLREAVEQAIQHEFEDGREVMHRASKIIISFIKNDFTEIEAFKRLTITFLTKDTNIEVV